MLKSTKLYRELFTKGWPVQCCRSQKAKSSFEAAKRVFCQRETFSRFLYRQLYISYIYRIVSVEPICAIFGCHVIALNKLMSLTPSLVQRIAFEPVGSPVNVPKGAFDTIPRACSIKPWKADLSEDCSWILRRPFAAFLTSNQKGFRAVRAAPWVGLRLVHEEVGAPFGLENTTWKITSSWKSLTVVYL